MGFGDSANHGASEATSSTDERECRDGGWVWQTDEAHHAVEGEHPKVGVVVVVGGDGVEDEVEPLGVLRECRGIVGGDEVIGTEAKGVVLFICGVGNYGDFGSHRVGEFDSHVTKTAEANDTDFHARADLPMSERGISRDSGAEERGGGFERDSSRNGDNVVLVDSDLGGVSAVSWGFTVSLITVIGSGHSAIAVLLKASFAVLTGSAGVYEYADANSIADFPFGDIRSDGRDGSNDFVAGDHWIDRSTPFVARLVEVGVADAAVEDIDEYVAG